MTIPPSIQPIDIQRVIQRVKLEREKFDKIEKQYRATKFSKEVEKRLKEEKWTIDTIVIMGLGPSGESTLAANNPNFTHADQTRWQLAYIRHISEVISDTSGESIAIYNQECYRSIFAGDPNDAHAWTYPAVFDTFLEELGIFIIRWPGSASDQYKPRSADEVGDAPKYIKERTLFYAPFLLKRTTIQVIEQGIDPECYIGVSLDTLLRHEVAVARAVGRPTSQDLKTFMGNRLHRFPPMFDVKDPVREPDVGLLGAMVWYRRRDECQGDWRGGEVRVTDEEQRMKRLSMGPEAARKKVKEEYQAMS